MSAPLKVLIMSLIWLLYTVLLFRVNMSHEGSAVETPMDSDTTEILDGVSEVNIFPIGFKWSVDSAFTTEGFTEFKKSILDEMDENNILEITGQYFEEEQKPDGAANMGFARAENIKSLFAGDIPEDRLRLRARVEDERDGVRTGYFESIDFEWIKPEEKAEETVETLEDRIIIRFPYGSAQKEYDPVVDEYIDKLAARVQETKESITLTGHTDNSGGTEYNYELGKDRAEAIRVLLINNGVPADLISTNSKGETQPVDSNETEEGRHNNRRVEVRLHKK